MSGISPETIGELVARYGEKAPPKCRICGADMALGEVGGGRVTWYCDGEPVKWMGMEPGSHKRLKERHFDDSRVIRPCGDHRVVELLNAYLKLTKCPTRTAISVLGKAAERLPEGWSIELEFSRNEVSMSLIDPSTGSDVDEYFSDFECSFLGAIETAVERAAKERR